MLYQETPSFEEISTTAWAIHRQYHSAIFMENSAANVAPIFAIYVACRVLHSQQSVKNVCVLHL